MNVVPIISLTGLAASAIVVGQFVSADPVSTTDRSTAVLAANVSAGDLDVQVEGGIPDVIVWEIFGAANWSSGDFNAYAIGTTSCNIGDVPLAWFANTNQHPVIGQNMFRLAPGANGHGRFEQIGQAWLKHGFCALSQTECGPCQATNCNTLGVGCSDPYTPGLNGSQFDAGPKWQVNASTGFYPYPPANPSWNGNVDRRLKVQRSDVLPTQNPDARYYFEAQYVCPDENPSISMENARNNTSWREGNLNFAGQLLGYANPTQQQQPAINAWKVADAEVELSTVSLPDEGTIFVASRAYDNGDGTWDYEYAIQNLDVHRSVGRVSVPVGEGVAVSDEGFNDVDYHSGEPFAGTDWTTSRDSAMVNFASETFEQNANANAIRWGTLYNYRFTAAAAPTMGEIELGMFRTGPVMSMNAAAMVPAEAVTCAADIDGSGTVEFGDLLEIISAFGPCVGCPADLDGNGEVDTVDLLTVLAAWGDC
ncbi:MAG: hypothetical protein AB8G96_09120 [Phycisphaerales bacterium]